MNFYNKLQIYEKKNAANKLIQKKKILLNDKCLYSATTNHILVNKNRKMIEES